MLASASANPEGDHDLDGGGGGGDVGGAANGASGFRFVGMIVGILARNRVVSAGFGAYGAANSVYAHFSRPATTSSIRKIWQWWSD